MNSLSDIYQKYAPDLHRFLLGLLGGPACQQILSRIDDKLELDEGCATSPLECHTRAGGNDRAVNGAFCLNPLWI